MGENEEIITEKFVFFNYEKQSGQKFLVLGDDAQILTVIPRDVKVPYINVGETYTFTGVYENHHDREIGNSLLAMLGKSNSI